MAIPYVHKLTTRDLPPNCGTKAEKIRQLLIYDKTSVPLTFVCTWDAYEAQLHGTPNLRENLRTELSEKLDLSRAYAVRSSANVEDGLSASFAGQFCSLLHVRGREALLAAIEHVWRSVQAAELESYLARTDYSAEQLRMAVILQEMVEPIVSGVAFSKNPITGLDEIVVEAVTGSGEALVQEGATPDCWVYKWGDWISRPQASVIDDDLILTVVEKTRTIAEMYGRAVDLEWVYNRQDVYWIQLREITALNHHNIYSNRISREMLPGIIKPLVWSVNTQLVNSAWIELFTELIGPNDILPEDLAQAFYYRAYFNMGTIGRIFEALGMPQETLEIMMGLEGGDQRPRFRPSSKVMKHVPRMLRFLLAKLRFGRDLDVFLPEMDRRYAAFADQDLSQLETGEMLGKIDELFAFTQQAAYRNIVGPLLMHAYSGLLRRRLEQAGIAYEQFDLTSGMAELEAFDPNPHLDRLAKRLAATDADSQRRVQNGTYADLQTVADGAGFGEDVAQFMAQFGHLSDSGNDFSRVPWRENPDLVRQMVATRVDGRSSHAQAVSPPRTPSPKMAWDDLHLGKFGGLRTRWLYRRARQFRYYREATSFKYTYGYGLFREYFLALAARFVDNGILKDREDIFMLYLDEVRAIVDGTNARDIPTVVARRRHEIGTVQDVVLPEIIYGDKPPPVEIYDASRRHLEGIPTSGGYFQGPVCVVGSLTDFAKMRPGAVLVIPYSDVGWVPLFAQAGAIVAESGGILSHSSIVAREYRIPAVVSIANACHLLRDDMMVTVDGFKGRVIVH